MRPLPSSPTVLAAGLALLGLACGCDGAPRPAAAPPGNPVLATANGVPVTEADVRQELVQSKMDQEELAPERRRRVVEHVVREELAAQKAAQLGLDADPQYAEEYARRLAELNAWRRQALSDRYFRAELAKRAQVSDEDLRRYFDEHQSEIRTEVRVLQILSRDERKISAAREQLAAGADFEEVARAQYPPMPQGERPWEMGYLKWMQIPEQWRPVVPKLKTGESSDVIRGPANRFWIIKIVDRREDPSLGFEQVKEPLRNDLQQRKQQTQRAELLQELEKSARVEYLK